MDDSRAIGRALRRERERAGLSQDAVAYLSGMSVRHVARVEGGESLASGSLDKMLKALNVRLVVKLEPRRKR